jgi:hypothetical protein
MPSDQIAEGRAAWAGAHLAPHAGTLPSLALARLASCDPDPGWNKLFAPSDLINKFFISKMFRFKKCLNLKTVQI